tara:strand:- start:23 stop:226 length:204 start_codon:yes stop_codon:yes gene_type:complete
MKCGDLVRIRKTAIDHLSTLWFIDLADNKTPLVLVERLDSAHPGWFVLRPDGSTFFILEENLTKRMY